MLAMVSHYRPKYFVLENVPAILDSKLLAIPDEDQSLAPENIEHGATKLIDTVLIALGYGLFFDVQVVRAIVAASQ